MVATAVTIATEVGKRNSVSIWLNNRISPAGNKDTSSTLLEKVPGKAMARAAQTPGNREMFSVLIPSPESLKCAKPDIFLMNYLFQKVNLKIFIIHICLYTTAYILKYEKQ